MESWTPTIIQLNCSFYMILLPCNQLNGQSTKCVCNVFGLENIAHMSRVGAPDSNLLLAGFQLESCEGIRPSNRDLVLLSKMETLKNRRN
jgi:hypothetical protein